MSDNKKYYYFRFSENFLNSSEMIVLESMQDGYLYSNILMKLYCLSLKDEGRLMLTERIPYNPETLAQVTRHQVGTVKSALQIFRDLELIEVLDSGAIYMTDIQNLIGKSGTEADRKREYRARISAEKEGVGHLSRLLSPEKEIELEIDKDHDDLRAKATKSPNNEIENFFESVWKLYPEKKGKGQISKSKKKALYNVGYEEIERCITRYKNDKPSDVRWKHGSTFFNSGYVDYLDINYEAVETPIFDSKSFEYQAASFIACSILSHTATFTALQERRKENTLQEWANDIHEMLENDGVGREEFRYVVSYSQSDEYWRTIITSGKALRKHYSTMLVRMNNQKNN